MLVNLKVAINDLFYSRMPSRTMVDGEPRTPMNRALVNRAR
jgi:hypothetical protein